MNERARPFMSLGGGMPPHNTAGFAGSSQQARGTSAAVPCWQVAPSSAAAAAAASLAKSAPNTAYMPSLGPQVAPMQGLGFDYTPVQAHQPRFPPPLKPHNQDLYTTPRYSDPAPYLAPTPGMTANYAFGGEMVEQWGMSLAGSLRSPIKKNKNQKKADGKQATFLTKLYQWVANGRIVIDCRLLEDPQNHRIIRWDETGTLIIIERPDELAEKILPQVYRQTRFASFSRQLNIYGWMRKVSLRHVDNGIADPDASTWSHQSLRRDSNKDEIQGYKRRVPPRPSQAQKNAARLAETMSLSSDSSDLHSPPGYTAHALGDLNEPKSIDFAAGPVPTLLPGDGTALHGFNLEPAVGPSAGPRVRSSEQPQVRRLSMPASTRPSLSLQQQRPMHLKQHSMPGVSLHCGLASFSQAYPTSMPPNTLQIVDQSSRPMAANSQQANMLSPSASMNALWIADESKDPDRLLRGTNDAPSFKVEDPSTWARRGIGTLGDGLRPTEPAPINASFTNPMQWLDGTTQDFQPGLPGSGMPTQPLIAAASKAVPPALQPAPSITAQAAAESVPPAPPTTPAAQGLTVQTVSPGVYQAGFSLQTTWMSPRTTPSPPTTTLSRPMPAATTTKSERRQSLTHPYSPANSLRTIQAGTLRQVGIGRNRDSLAMAINAAPAGAGDDGALPSASLSQPELFAEIEAKPSLE
ncbi:hypothetical protein CspeluHIS016_0106350 [Cutaneotrichosporon spelunceum]|uniref:HSF-type DNA-binding domain-containing protein n=1 Tax=Cutaneotrichosporon spelunceum TaxID=1672016 RepID=A0AAD3TP56_9TREE|nr:hypothetical protein CspeluHIS016_0106350 [Cutaneotrichosporon spelunceum]